MSGNRNFSTDSFRICKKVQRRTVKQTDGQTDINGLWYICARTSNTKLYQNPSSRSRDMWCHGPMGQVIFSTQRLTENI